MDSTRCEEPARLIEQIRKDKFGIEPDGTKHPNLLERDLRAALRNLAEELNAKPVFDSSEGVRKESPRFS